MKGLMVLNVYILERYCSLKVKLTDVNNCADKFFNNGKNKTEKLYSVGIIYLTIIVY